MKKTYWWRIMIVFLNLIAVTCAYVILNKTLFGLCENIYSFGNSHGCLDKSAQTIGKPLLFMSLSLLAISPFLFFVRDVVFLKWLRFAIAWFMLAFIFITLVPVSTGGWMNFGPTKESVSIWMGSPFVILSLVQIVWLSRKK